MPALPSAARLTPASDPEIYRFLGRRPGSAMTPAEGRSHARARWRTGFADVTYDLIAVQYHALKAADDYGQYVRDAGNAGLNDIAQVFRDTIREDSTRAARAHELLKNITGTGQAGPAAQ